MKTPLTKDDAIIIVGAGIFGLSTALHLTRRGYKNVTVFDRQNYDEKLYSYQKGCDAASAGMWIKSGSEASFKQLIRFEQNYSLSLWHTDRIPRAFVRSD